jgi:hypothetical protein
MQKASGACTDLGTQTAVLNTISQWLLAEVRAAAGQTSARNQLLAQVSSPPLESTRPPGPLPVPPHHTTPTPERDARARSVLLVPVVGPCPSRVVYVPTQRGTLSERNESLTTIFLQEGVL